MDDPTLRLTDADRDAAAEALGEHYVSGRLDLEEYDQRLDQVHAARTPADLLAPFEALPRPAALAPRRAAAVPARRAPDVWARAATVASGFSTLLFLVCGFALDGWAWSWLFFLLPGALATLSPRNDPEPAPPALPDPGGPR
ncbi:MAG: DUF1707 SHOCT-like domain-containing protein [Marmoricola sp.]